MTGSARGLAAVAALLLALATIIGALGAHVLQGRLGAHQAQVLDTAVYYQFFHSLGLLGVGVLLDRLAASRPRAAAGLRVAGWLLAAGIVLFSGSLYALVAGVPGLAGYIVGALTPLGGVSLILAWCLVAWTLARERSGG